MYSQFFGFTAPPFRITPDTTFFYSGGERGALITAIAYGIVHGDGLIKVVGEVGSGKTMLSRMLAKQLPDNTTVVFLLNPSLQACDLVFAIAQDLGLEIDSQCSKNHALHLVQSKLLAMHADNQRVVVFIDEAQCMPLETLEELRLLSNFETETDKLLQLVLFGQPELDDHLAHTSVRQIKERIIHSFYLKPFSRNEVAEYLSFRLHKAGYNGSAIFTGSALKRLTRVSTGLPRKLTILADKSLLAAFSAQSKIVKASHVRLAAKDSGQAQSRVTRKSMGLIALFLALLISGVVFYNTLPLSLTLHESQAKDSASLVLEDRVLIADVVAVKQYQHFSTATVIPTTSATTASTEMNILSAPADTVVTLETLIEKTQQWMQSSSGVVYTIQILSANIGDDEFLEIFFENIARDIGLDELYIHPVSVDGKAFLAVTLGGFTTLNQATAYLDSLPDFILRYQPYIKNIASFKSPG
ncbi:MAG: AAA family ATPase [Gammaproteobacteria bacterium]|nr:AAA family ATPase [Gammaproteobacteria bacterium]MBQ0838766.1 AAA family ATPase [Gammaproteobacteria bacterium]